MTPKVSRRGGAAAPLNLTQTTLTGMLWMSWGKAGRGILQIGVLALMARLVSPTDFGVVNAALVVVEFSSIFAHVGLGKALIQHPALRPAHVATAVSTSLFLGLVIGGIVWIAAPALAGFFRIALLAPILRILAWSFPLRGLAAASESILLREFRFKWLATRELASYMLGYGLVGVILASKGWGVWALATAHLAQTIVNTTLLLAARPVSFRCWPERRAFQELAYFSGGYTLARVANYAADQGDTVVVGRSLGPAALGLYGRAAQLMAVPAGLLGDILDNVLFPTLARAQEDVPRLSLAYRRGVSMIALVMLPTSVMFYMLAPEIIGVLLGAGWHSVVTPFRVFAVALLFRTSCRMSDALARATGYVYRRAWRQWLYAALVVGGAGLGQFWGVEGAAVGVAIALFTNFVMMAHLSITIAGLSWRSFASAHVPACVLAGAAGVIVQVSALVTQHSGLPSIARLAIGLSATAGLLVLLAKSFPELCLGRDGVWMIHQLQARFPSLRNLKVAADLT